MDFRLLLLDLWDGFLCFFIGLIYVVTNKCYPYRIYIPKHVTSIWSLPAGKNPKKQVGIKYIFDPTIIEWLEKNAKRYIIIETFYCIFFFRKQDAILFKLTFNAD